MRPSCRLPPTSAAASLAAAPATSGVGYLCLAYPAAASHTVTTTTAAHLTLLLQPSPGLPHYRGSAGSTEVLAVSISDVALILGLTRVASQSSLCDLSFL